MALALPRPIQLKLEQTLAQSPRWLCEPPLDRAPRIVKALSRGISNFSVLVKSGQLFVVRIDGISPSSHGLNRQTEWRALEAANRAGLAPRPRYFNPELGSLVCDYLPPDNSGETDPAKIAQLLRRIHRLPSRHHRLDLAERIRRYEKQLEHRGRSLGNDLKWCSGRVSELVYDISRHPTDAVLCHNDLLQANRIYSGGKLWAVDWEYCAMGSPWYDIAVIVNGDSLSTTDTDILLAAYLGRMPVASERTTLHQYGCIYRYLELLWYMTLDDPVLGPDAIAGKSVALNTMLEGCKSQLT